MTPDFTMSQGQFEAAHLSGDSPFDLSNESAYRKWRDARLDAAPSCIGELLVPVQDPRAPTPGERAALLEAVSRCNMAFYRCSTPDNVDRQAVRRFGEALGLRRLDANLCSEEDGISELQVSDGGRQTEYIPYTDRPLSWHCDGYYNTPEQRIRAMLLHCVSDAEQGGENAFMDHELIYIRLRDENPAWIRALSRPDAFTIPPNVENGVTLRPARGGPVFSVDPDTGRLHMRYTARQRNIQWRDDADTRDAVARISGLLAEEGPYLLRYRLRPGEGVVCNNVLHARTGFQDAAESGRRRLIYRARYLDRIAGT